MTTRIIALVNQKGGVGKTTTTANLGAYLAHLERRVLLIDLDPQANLSLHYGYSSDKFEKSCYDLLMKGNHKPVELIIKTKQENLDLIPASIKLADAELELVNVVGRERVLAESLDGIVRTGNYDYILMDCAPTLGLLTLNALTTANEVFIPVQADYFALQGIGRLAHTLDLVKKRLNPDLAVTGVVVCLFNSRRKLSWEVVEKVKTYFKNKLFETQIRVDVKLAEAPSFGRSILKYAPSSKGAEDYLKLSREVVKGEKRRSKRK